MDASTPAGKLLNALKQRLKANGLHYSDVAARLKVSETTVKRYFSGKGVSIDILVRLAAIVDLDLFSLTMLAQQKISERGLTMEQRASLRRSKFSVAVFHFLTIGFTPNQLVKEFDLAGRMEGILARLEAGGLIRRLSNNNIKILVKPDVGGEVDEHTEERKVRKINMTRQFLSEIDLHNEKCEWMHSIARLSPASVVRLRELMNRFLNDVQALTKSEISLPREETQWYRLFVSADPVSREKYFQES